MSRNTRIVYGTTCNMQTRHYGFFHFIWDCFLTIITCGLWLIWIFVREMRNR